MAAIDDLTELVERAAVAERIALSSKWKERAGRREDGPRTSARTRSRSARRPDTRRRSAMSCRRAGCRCGRTISTWVRRSTCRSGSRPRTEGSPPSRPAGPVRRLSHAAAAQAERDAVAAVELARIALTDAALAVLQARLARIDAGEDDPDAAVVDGHVPLHGRNPVSRHGPALAHGRDRRDQVHPHPQAAVHGEEPGDRPGPGPALPGLHPGVPSGTRDQQWLPYLGLWVIGVVMGGGVCINAMSFDAMRVRAALDSGARLWHLLVIKNLALLCIVAPIGFLLSALLAWRAGDIYAFYKACALMVCMILLWLGVGNVLSIALPTRDEPIRQRKQSGSLKQFIIAFIVSDEKYRRTNEED